MSWFWFFIFLGTPVVLMPFAAMLGHRFERMKEKSRG